MGHARPAGPGRAGPGPVAATAELTGAAAGLAAGLAAAAAG